MLIVKLLCHLQTDTNSLTTLYRTCPTTGDSDTVCHLQTDANSLIAAYCGDMVHI